MTPTAANPCCQDTPNPQTRKRFDECLEKWNFSVLVVLTARNGWFFGFWRQLRIPRLPGHVRRFSSSTSGDLRRVHRRQSHLSRPLPGSAGGGSWRVFSRNRVHLPALAG